MPIYKYKCLKCKTEEEEFVWKREEIVLCETCGEPRERQFPDGLGPINFGFPTDGIILEHAEANPVHLKSRREAQEYARKHNVQLGCL